MVRQQLCLKSSEETLLYFDPQQKEDGRTLAGFNNQNEWILRLVLRQSGGLNHQMNTVNIALSPVFFTWLNCVVRFANACASQVWPRLRVI